MILAAVAVLAQQSSGGGLGDIPGQGVGLAAIIGAFGTVIGTFLYYIFKDGSRGDRSTAYAFAVQEGRIEDLEEKLEKLEEEKRQLRVELETKYEGLLRDKDDDRERLAEECRRIRDERDAALIELAKVRRSSQED